MPDTQPDPRGDVLKTVLTVLQKSWAVIANLLAVLSIASMTDQLVVWSDFIQGLILHYRSIIDPVFVKIINPVFEFLLQWISFKVPRWLHDYLTIGVLFAFGPLLRGGSALLADLWRKRKAKGRNRGAEESEPTSEKPESGPPDSWISTKSTPIKAIFFILYAFACVILLGLVIVVFAFGMIANALFWPIYLFSLYGPSSIQWLALGIFGAAVAGSPQVIRSMRLTAIFVPIGFCALLLGNYIYLRFIGA